MTSRRFVACGNSLILQLYNVGTEEDMDVRNALLTPRNSKAGALTRMLFNTSERYLIVLVTCSTVKWITTSSSGIKRTFFSGNTIVVVIAQILYNSVLSPSRCRLRL